MYSVFLEQFEGPLALLLELIESAELDVTSVSLSRVADQFLQHLEAHPVSPDELADFLLVASKLLVLKSKSLFPEIEIPEEAGIPLELQLGMYRVYHDKAREIERMIKAKKWAYWRKPVAPLAQFIPPPTLEATTLHEAWERVLGIIKQSIELPKVAMRKTVTITERIRHIEETILKHARLSFKQYTTGASSKAEVIVSFLAILELARRQMILLDQGSLFDDITITHYAEPQIAR